MISCMKMTLTMDNDAAAALEHLSRSRGAGLEDVANEALRRGLHDMEIRPQQRKPFRTQSVDCGGLLIDNVDNVAEILALIEGDAFK
jgi:predicted flavoprotein YhiN